MSDMDTADAGVRHRAPHHSRSPTRSRSPSNSRSPRRQRSSTRARRPSLPRPADRGGGGGETGEGGGPGVRYMCIRAFPVTKHEAYKL